MKRFLQSNVPVGLVCLLLAGSWPALAATRKSAASKSTAAPAPKTSAAARSGYVSRDPYLGAIVVEAGSGKVLFEDQADAKGYPASVLKLMDLLIIFEKIEQKQLSYQDTVVVSARAAKIGGAQVWLAEKETFTVDELLYALMVKSANDAAGALAEKVAGTMEAFVEMMNKRARELGMVNTVFHSVHGLPPGAGQEPDVTTARDLTILCRALLKYPETLRYTSTRKHPFRPNGPMVMMETHNPLLAQFEGCDGFKTGYFAKAGFSIAVTASRRGQRVIAIILGSVDRKVRDAKAKELLAKGFLALEPSAPTPPPASVPPRKAAK